MFKHLHPIIVETKLDNMQLVNYIFLSLCLYLQDK